MKEGVLERQDLQRWIRSQPEILGEDLLILTEEFSRWDKSDDRIDLLALDRTGTLVVIELKRTDGAGTAEIQAIRYAALAATLTMDHVRDEFAKFQSSRGEPVTSEQAEAQIREFISDDPDFDDFGEEVRIFLCARAFGPSVMTTVHWLSQRGVSFTCIELTPYSNDREKLIVPRKVFPIAGLEEITSKAREAHVARRKTERKRGEKKMAILLNQGRLQDGDSLTFILPPNASFKDGAPKAVFRQEGLDGWLEWQGERYRISPLTQKLFQDGGVPVPPTIQGTKHWSLDSDPSKSLADLADEIAP